MSDPDFYENYPACPTCKVGKGERCRAKSGYQYEHCNFHHQSRSDLVKFVSPNLGIIVPCTRCGADIDLDKPHQYLVANPKFKSCSNDIECIGRQDARIRQREIELITMSREDWKRIPK